MNTLRQDFLLLILRRLRLFLPLWFRFRVLSKQSSYTLQLLTQTLSTALPNSEEIIQEYCHEYVKEDEHKSNAVITPSGAISDGHLGKVLVRGHEWAVTAIGRSGGIDDIASCFGGVWAEIVATCLAGWWLHYCKFVFAALDWAAGNCCPCNSCHHVCWFVSMYIQEVHNRFEKDSQVNGDTLYMKIQKPGRA